MRECATTLAAEMTPEELDLLGRTVAALRFEHGLLEIGSAAGGSLVAMLRVLQRSDQSPRVACIDPMTYFDGQLETVRTNLRQNGFSPDRVEFRVGKSPQFLRAARRAAERWDLILIDANHKFRHVVMDLRWSDLLAPRGRLVLHDFAPSYPGVWKGVRSFLRRNAYYRVVEQAGSLVVLEREASMVSGFRVPETSARHVVLANVLTPISQLLKGLKLDFLKLT